MNDVPFSRCFDFFLMEWVSASHSYPPFYGYQYSETMGCHQKSPTDYYGDINYDEFPNGSDIMGVHMASKSSKKVTFEFVLKLLNFFSDI